jgi:hypothetical protein
VFTENKPTTDPNIFTSFDQTLNKKKLKRLEDKTSWDNLFREQIVSCVDEKLFLPLYSQDNGRPNSSIRILVGMMILKEGFGWSDAELYESCRFNLLVMNSLGLTNISDEVPVESTYYDFKKKLYEYENKTGRSLIAELFDQTTERQAEIFSVNTRWIRMDSKLIGSNIANCTRLQLIISCIQEFYRSLDEQLKKMIRKKERKELDELMKQKPYQITYKLTDKQKSEYLYKMGILLDKLVDIFRDRGDNNLKGMDKDKYLMISRLLSEQYNKSKTDGHLEVKSGKEVPSGAIQSAYDTDAAYTNKQFKSVKGYSVNLVESCDNENLNIITAVEVYKANTIDKDMLIDGLEQTEKLTGIKVEKISVDGGYNSSENQEYAEKNRTDIYLSGITGISGDYDIEEKEGKLIFINKTTGQKQTAHITKGGKYRIERDDRHRYFTAKQIESYNRRKEVENLPKEIRDVRCNVEASIFQMCYHLRKDKSRYRGLIKVNIWARCRAMWMNIIRIKNHIESLYPVPHLCTA